VAGCGSSSAKISSEGLKQRVLRPADLAAGYTTFADASTASLDTQGTSRADPGRFGRRAGWVVRLKRAASTKRRPAIVVSAVDVFADAKGAKSDLDAYAHDIGRQAGSGLAKRLSVENLGDGAVAARLTSPGSTVAFTIAWREKNATASITATGFAGKLDFADVVALARRQEAKLVPH
jgi:hypothetical protein